MEADARLIVLLCKQTPLHGPQGEVVLPHRFIIGLRSCTVNPQQRIAGMHDLAFLDEHFCHQAA